MPIVGQRLLNFSIKSITATLMICTTSSASSAVAASQPTPQHPHATPQPAAVRPKPTPQPLLPPGPADFGFADSDPNVDFTRALQNALKPGARIIVGATTVQESIVVNIYQPKGYQPLFVDAHGITPLGASLRQLLTQQSVLEGLNAVDYWNSDIAARATQTSPRALLELDLLLANSLISFASDLFTGRTNPTDATQNISDIELGKRTFKSFDVLLAALATPDPVQMNSLILTLAPTHSAYAKLKAELARLLDVQSHGGFAALTFKKTITAGASDASVAVIRERLIELGALGVEERGNLSPVFDGKMSQAVSVLQEAEKVPVNGNLGKSTYATLNMKVEARINQVRANLEKWRLMPRNLGPTYIFVNLGDQTFKLYDNSSEPLISMRVVIGQELRETPTFIDQINEVIINPYWNAPTDIIVKDVLPKALRDPNYFYEMHIRIFDHGGEIDPNSVDWSQYSLTNKPPFSFREEPGPNNSLGVMKFNLSQNHHDIYMHDTNHRELFAQEKRQYSSGCIRLQHPFDLADYLLGPLGMSDADLQMMTQDPSIRAKHIAVPQALRVYVIGTTISVSDETDAVFFGPDIYNQDERIVAALNGLPIPPASPRIPGSGGLLGGLFDLLF